MTRLRLQFASSLFALAVLSSATSLFAQSRDFGARRLLLDDGAVGILTIEYAGPGNGLLVIPNGGGTIVDLGGGLNHTLRWDGTEWVSSGALLNDGTDLFASGIINGNGSGLTSLNASNISSGSLDLARISTAGALADQALMFDGVDLVYGNPEASSMTLPWVQSAADASDLIDITQTGTGNGATFRINNVANNSTALSATTTGTGTALSVASGGSGAALTAVSSFAGTGSVLELYSFNNANASPAMSLTSTGPGSILEIAGVHPTTPTLGVNINYAGMGHALRVTRSNTDPFGASFYAIGGVSEGYGAGLYGSSQDGYGAVAISENATALRVFNINAANSVDLIRASTNGTARGMHIELTNVASSANGLHSNVAGTGAALRGEAFSGSGIHATSLNGHAGEFYSQFNTALDVETDGFGLYGIQVQAVNGSGIQLNVLERAIRVINGSMIGSYSSIAHAAAIPDDMMIVHIQDNAGGVASAALPAGENGKILFVTSDDADGFSVGGFSGATGELKTFVYVAGAWRSM